MKNSFYLLMMFISLLFLQFVICTCDASATEPEKLIIGKGDFPLKPGLVVEYKMKSGHKGMDGMTVKHEYSDSGEFQGDRFFRRIAIMSDGSREISYFFFSDKGLTRVPAVSSSEKSLILKMPLSVGDEWEQKDYVGTKVVSMKKTAVETETIETPLGKLNCIKVRQRKADATDEREDSFVYVAPQYGIVKIELNTVVKTGDVIHTAVTITKFSEPVKDEDGKEKN